MVDSADGNLANRPASTCASLIGLTLAPAATSPPCTYTATLTGPQGTRQTGIVTVTGNDIQGNMIKASAQTTVAITAPGTAVITGQNAVGIGGSLPGLSLPITGLDDRPVALAIGLILTGLLLLIGSGRGRRYD